MPRASNTSQRRTEIAEALLAVMAKQGYEGASIVAVARHAGLAAGLVHYHFDSKLAILLEAVRLLAERHLAALDAALEVAPDPRAGVAAFIDVHLGLGAHADPGGLACWVLIGAEAIRDRRVQVEHERALAAIAARLAAIIERGVAARCFAGVEPAAAAAALVAVVEGYFVVAATARAVVPRGSAAACALRMADGLLHTDRPLAIVAQRPPARARRPPRRTP